MPKYKVDLWMSQEYIFYVEAKRKQDIPRVLKENWFMVDDETILHEEKIGGSRLDDIEEIKEMTDKEFTKEVKELGNLPFSFLSVS